MELHKTIAKFIMTGAILFGIAACTSNFEDYNKNPYEPDINEMLVDGYLERALVLSM